MHALAPENLKDQDCMTTKQIVDFLVQNNNALVMRAKNKYQLVNYYLNKLAVAGAVKKYSLIIGRYKDCWGPGDPNAIRVKPKAEPAKPEASESSPAKSSPPRRPLNKFKPWWPEGTVT